MIDYTVKAQAKINPSFLKLTWLGNLSQQREKKLLQNPTKVRLCPDLGAESEQVGKSDSFLGGMSYMVFITLAG